MTLQIELNYQSEAWLADEARRRGVAPADVVRAVIEERAGVDGRSETPTETEPQVVDRNHFYYTASQDEFVKALDGLARKDHDLPDLSVDAFDRDLIYGDRGL